MELSTLGGHTQQTGPSRSAGNHSLRRKLTGSCLPRAGTAEMRGVVLWGAVL